MSDQICYKEGLFWLMVLVQGKGLYLMMIFLLAESTGSKMLHVARHKACACICASSGLSLSSEKVTRIQS
jgi:hypothetical protein